MNIFKKNEIKYYSVKPLVNKAHRHKCGLFWKFNRVEIERNETLDRILEELKRINNKK